MDFTVIGATYTTVSNVCEGKFDIIASTMQAPGEWIYDLYFVSSTSVLTVNSIDGVPAPGCYPVFVPAGGTPAVISVDVSTVPTYPSLPDTVNTFWDDGVTITQLTDTYLVAALNNLLDYSSYDFGPIPLGNPQFIQFTLTAGNVNGFLFPYTATITLINNTGGFVLDPSIDGIPFTISNTNSYPVPITFTPPSVGSFSADLNVEITNPGYSCNQSWIVPLTGSGVTPPTPGAFKSERLSIMNGISI